MKNNAFHSKIVAIGSIAQESNSFSPFLTKLTDFTILRDKDILQKFSDVTKLFEDHGIQIVPTLSAYALPGGAVDRDAFLTLCDELVSKIPENADGVWLMLHGALFVEGLGEDSSSGEEYLLRRIREKCGDDIPVAACMDMHANHTKAFISRMNIIRGYHTAPHEDWDYRNCNRITAAALIETLAGKKMRTWFKRIPMRLFGEQFMTDYSPAKETIRLSEELERNPDVLCATVFVGMAWCDCSYNTMSIAVTAYEASDFGDALMEPLYSYLLEHRERYDIPAKSLPLEEALQFCDSSGRTPFFISDSGDNVTAGAAGDNALVLHTLLETGRSGYLVAGIADNPFVQEYADCPAGTACRLPLGAKTDASGVCVKVTGILKDSKVCDIGACKAVRCLLVDYGENSVIVTDMRCDFTLHRDIELLVDDLKQYKGVVVKLGYLFPDLREIASDSCIALTAGSCCLDAAQIHYKTGMQK